MLDSLVRLTVGATKISQLWYITLPISSLSLSATKSGVAFGKIYSGSVKQFVTKFSQLCFIILPTSSLSLSATKSGVLLGKTIMAGMFNSLAAYAAANPALPPEAHTIFLHPRSTA